jgi:predicted Zn-dependent peptidase
MASVSVGLWVGVGGRHEPAPLSGVSHFIEHMLFKGTRRRTAKEISESVEGAGGYLNAFTTEDSACFYAKARHDQFEKLIEVLMDMFLNSTFAPRDVEKERDVIKEELAMYLDEPHHHVHELLDAMLWPDHALGRSLTGTEKTLDAMRRRVLMDYQRANYVAGSTVIVVAGNIPHQRVMKSAQRFAPNLFPGRPLVPAPFVEGQAAPRVQFFTTKSAQLHMALGIKTCSRHDERRFALRVLNALLGESMSSRLFQVLREDRGLAYSVHSNLTSLDDVGTLTIDAGLDPANLPEALRLMRRELRRLREIPAGATEMRRAKDYLIGQMELGLEGTENQMNWLGEQWLAYGRIIPPKEIQRGLNAVTAGQVCNVARQFFRPERVSLAVVSPLRESSRLKKLLQL